MKFTAECKAYQTIEDGDYETVLKMEWKKTLAGDQYINCCFTVVDGPYEGCMVFDGIYIDKKTGDFQANKINGILSTIPNCKKEFDSYDELIQYLNGTHLIVHIQIQPEHDGYPERNIVKFMSYLPSKLENNDGTPKNDIKLDLPF